MTRYTKQYDNYSCGPVAIINALKWAEIPASLSKDRKRIKKLAKCKPPKGVSPDDLDHAIHQVLEFDPWLDNNLSYQEACRREIQIEWDKSPDLRSLRAHLKQDTGAAIIRHMWWSKKKKEWLGHYFLAVGLTSGGKYYYTINMFEGKKSKLRVSSKKFIKELTSNRKKLRCWYLMKHQVEP